VVKVQFHAPRLHRSVTRRRRAATSGLGCFPVLALAQDMGLPAPDIDQDEAIGRADAIAIIDEVFGHMFPGLREVNAGP
jgi:hypothetical protein